MTTARWQVPAVWIGAVALALSSCGPNDRQSPAALVGRWEGHIAWRDATTPLTLEVARDGDSLVATFGAPALGVEHLAAGRLSYAAPRVHLVVPDSSAPVAFDGWLRRGLVVGSLSSAALGSARNPALLPQFSLRQKSSGKRRMPWPDSLMGGPPPVVRTAERSLGAWLGARAGR